MRRPHPATLVLCLLALGCASFTSLREGRYEEVPPDVLAAAGESEAEDLPDAVASLLQVRLEDPELISEEQAIEAVIALGKIGTPDRSALALKLAQTDPSSSVRYFAVHSLSSLDPALFLDQAGQLLQKEVDPLVRTEIQNLLDHNSTPTVP